MYIQGLVLRQVYTGLCVYSGFGLDRFIQDYVYIQGLV